MLAFGSLILTYPFSTRGSLSVIAKVIVAVVSPFLRPEVLTVVAPVMNLELYYWVKVSLSNTVAQPTAEQAEQVISVTFLPVGGLMMPEIMTSYLN